MVNEPMTEYLPQVRCTATLKDRLVRVASRGAARELADHIRYAVELYVAAEELKNPLPPQYANGKAMVAEA